MHDPDLMRGPDFFGASGQSRRVPDCPTGLMVASGVHESPRSELPTGACRLCRSRIRMSHRSTPGVCSMSVSSFPAPALSATRRRYAIVGLGSRHELYQDGIEKTHARWSELVGVCDLNPGRVELARRRSALNGACVPVGYAAADFRRMLREQRPDVVIVTTSDASHHEYLIQAMESGCDVITEKPMTTDEVTCRQI